MVAVVVLNLVGEVSDLQLHRLERESYQLCQRKSHRMLSFAFLALLGEATIVVACVSRVKAISIRTKSYYSTLELARLLVVCMWGVALFFKMISFGKFAQKTVE